MDCRLVSAEISWTTPNERLKFRAFGNNLTWQSPGAAFDGIASYSNRGPVPSVDISAPGGDRLTAAWPSQSLIVSPCSRQFLSGTTFPCAAGNFFSTHDG